MQLIDVLNVIAELQTLEYKQDEANNTLYEAKVETPHFSISAKLYRTPEYIRNDEYLLSYNIQVGDYTISSSKVGLIYGVKGNLDAVIESSRRALMYKVYKREVSFE